MNSILYRNVKRLMIMILIEKSKKGYLMLINKKVVKLHSKTNNVVKIDTFGTLHSRMCKMLIEDTFYIVGNVNVSKQIFRKLDFPLVCSMLSAFITSILLSLGKLFQGKRFVIQSRDNIYYVNLRLSMYFPSP
jgi:hypothetical protein